MTWLVDSLPPIMFIGLVALLLTGFPVAFSLAATGMVFGWIGVEMGLVPAQFFNALPLRLYGIMANDLLLAIPFFTLMGLISLPIMMRYGYNQPLAAGVITASGTLAQIIPPSLVLIVIAEQFGQSVGDMYKAAFIPAFTLVEIYGIVIMVIAVARPKWVPALPPEARVYRESTGSAGSASLLTLSTASAVVAGLVAINYPAIKAALGGDPAFAPATDETVVVTLMAAIVFAFIVAIIDDKLGLNLLSRLARQVTFVLIPPLLLVFLVLAGARFVGPAVDLRDDDSHRLDAVLADLHRHQRQ